MGRKLGRRFWIGFGGEFEDRTASPHHSNRIVEFSAFKTADGEVSHSKVFKQVLKELSPSLSLYDSSKIDDHIAVLDCIRDVILS